MSVTMEFAGMPVRTSPFIRRRSVLLVGERQIVGHPIDVWMLANQGQEARLRSAFASLDGGYGDGSPRTCLPWGA